MRRLILITATCAAVVGLVAGSAQAQAPAPPGGQFVLVGVVMLEGGREIAWVQEPNFTGNKILAVRLGDSVGPYRVTKILTHQVELTGPGGTVVVPLAGVPGAVTVASNADSGQRPAGEASPPAGTDPNNTAGFYRGDKRLEFPAAKMFVGAGAQIYAPMAPWQPPPPAPQAASAQGASGTAATRAAASGTSPSPWPSNASDFRKGDPRLTFPAAKMFIGAR